MVQLYQSPVRVYKHPFALVMLAYERRFPTCPQIPVFVGCEVIKDEESQGGAIRTTERRCKLNVEAPYILKKIIGVDFVYFIQKNILDRRNSILEIEAWNESFSARVTVLEKCRYFVHPENSEWTCFEQTSSLDIKNFFGFENSMEKLAMKQYAQNISKGKEIIEYFVNELKEQGVTYVEPWVDPERTPTPNKKTLEIEESNEPNTETTAETKLSGNKEIKLSSDYIERYLGKLDLMQESKLLQLRQSIQELRGASVPNDSTLLRFLRAREFMVDKAKEMLTQSLHWRKKYQIDKLLEEYEAPRVVKDYFPGGWHHCDKDGRPLYILRLGQMDVKGLLKSIGEDELLLLALHICEEGLLLMDEATSASGHPVSQWCLLIDLEGLNMRHLWRPGIKALLRIIEIVEANYPETMGQVLIIRAPRCFPILWTLISTFIHENTRNKFIFYCGSDYQEQNEGGLTDYIDPEYIPDFLGGPSEYRCLTETHKMALCAPLIGGCYYRFAHVSIFHQLEDTSVGVHLYAYVCKDCSSTANRPDVEQKLPYAKSEQFCITVQHIPTFIMEGGVVPKSLYRLELDGTSNDHEHSLYHSISLGHGQFHHVAIKTNDPGAVLTWDFDVMRHNVIFTVLHEIKDSITKVPSEEICSGDSETSATKEWKEGIDCTKVEPSITCHDGESIQGTHIIQETGTYILQWENPAGGEFLPSISSHKAQLMYFYEVLPSAHYRGSMMSLQSAVSGRSVASSSLSR